MTSTAASSLLVNPPDKTHIALVYDDEGSLYSAIADYINEGLARGQFCVYASVSIRDGDHIEKISPLIRDYHAHTEKGNLLVVDLAPYYISALLGDTQPFEDTKRVIAERVKDRADKHVRFVGDGTGFMFKNRHFDECTAIEEWWQQKPFEGSYVCPYAKSLFDIHPYHTHARRTVITTHDITIDSHEYVTGSQGIENKEGDR